MTAHYKSFAVVGTGTIGSFIVEELLKRQATVKILTRDASKPELQTFKDGGAYVVEVDYAKADDVKAALTGVDVVVSTLSIFGLASQLELIPAANAAGVKLFLPSEFGLKFAEGPNAVKITVRDLFKTVDLPSTLVFTGLFADIFQHSMGYNYAEDHIRVVGQGNTAFSLTSRTDIARFVAQALTTSSPANLEWAELSIEGDRKTPLEIKAIAEKTLGKPFQTRFVDYEQNAEAAASGDFIACLSKVLEDGNAVAGSADKVKETVAKLFPDRNPSPIEAYIQYNHVHWT